MDVIKLLLEFQVNIVPYLDQASPELLPQIFEVLTIDTIGYFKNKQYGAPTTNKRIQPYYENILHYLITYIIHDESLEIVEKIHLLNELDKYTQENYSVIEKYVTELKQQFKQHIEPLLTNAVIATITPNLEQAVFDQQLVRLRQLLEQAHLYGVSGIINQCKFLGLSVIQHCLLIKPNIHVIKLLMDYGANLHINYPEGSSTRMLEYCQDEAIRNKIMQHCNELTHFIQRCIPYDRKDKNKAFLVKLSIEVTNELSKIGIYNTQQLIVKLERSSLKHYIDGTAQRLIRENRLQATPSANYFFDCKASIIMGHWVGYEFDRIKQPGLSTWGGQATPLQPPASYPQYKQLDSPDGYYLRPQTTHLTSTSTATKLTTRTRYRLFRHVEITQPHCGAGASPTTKPAHSDDSNNALGSATADEGPGVAATCTAYHTLSG